VRSLISNIQSGQHNKSVFEFGVYRVTGNETATLVVPMLTSFATTSWGLWKIGRARWAVEGNGRSFPTHFPEETVDYAPRVFNRAAHPVEARMPGYHPRTQDLPDVINLEELHRIRGVPGGTGVDLAAGSIDRNVFRRMWELSDHHGIEYGLVRILREDGTEVWRLYSGQHDRVVYRLQRGERITRYGGHTHPSGNYRPSYFYDEDMGRMAGDVESLNRLWESMDFVGKLPHSRVIYGPGARDFTQYFPNVGR